MYSVRKQGCTLAYTVPGDTSIMAEPSWLQKLEEAGHIEQATRKQSEQEMQQGYKSSRPNPSGLLSPARFLPPKGSENFPSNSTSEGWDT